MDYVLYHNLDRMGYDALSVDLLSFYTNKRTKVPVGARVWFIAGEGRPRTFMLRGVMLVKSEHPSDNPDFERVIAGKEGRLFDTMPVLNEEPWFDGLKREQGNFGFGFQPIYDPAALIGLRALAKKRSLV
jgi:hypothetical protein